MRTTLFLALLGTAAVVACEKRGQADPRPTVSRALRGVLVYPRSLMLEMDAGDSVGQITLTTADSFPRVVAWFHEAFRLNGWEMQSDAADREGIVTLYAQRGRRPVWVRLHANVGGPGTTYTVTGGIVSGDTVK